VVAAQTVPWEQKFAPGMIGAAQLVASALYHCTLAICERLDAADVPELLKKIDEESRKGMN
jgi:hypothetical protein